MLTQMSILLIDAIDIGDNYDGDQEIPGGIPYDIKYVFHKEKACQ